MEVSREEFETYEAVKEKGNVRMSIWNVTEISEATNLTRSTVTEILTHYDELKAKYPNWGTEVKPKQKYSEEMNPKYTTGQKVRICFIPDQYGEPKYPKLRKYLHKTGIIVDCSYGFGSDINLETSTPTFYYAIRLQKSFNEQQKSIWGVPEEALELA